MVREVAQNSLDARKDDTKPVSLNFRLFKVSKSDCPEVVALKENLEQCCKIAEEQQLEDVVSFYSTAIQKIDQLEQIPFLGIHDSNTTGLTGPVEGPSGAWHALVKVGSLPGSTPKPLFSTKRSTLFEPTELPGEFALHGRVCLEQLLCVGQDCDTCCDQHGHVGVSEEFQVVKEGLVAIR